MVTSPAPRARHDEHRIAATPSSTHDTLICLVLDVALVPFFAYLLFVCLINGPEEFFGEFNRHAGVVAIELAALTVVAASCWAMFFVSYRRAGVLVRALGCLVCGAAALTAALLAYEKFTQLDSRPTTHPHDTWPSHDGRLLAMPALAAVLAFVCAVAMRRPRARRLAAVPAALVAVVGLFELCRELLTGDFNPFRLAVIGFPFVCGMALLAALFPSRALPPRAPSHPSS